MKRRWFLLLLISLLAAGCALGALPGPGNREEVLRLGYFPNLTHAQAVLGVADGSLERAAGVRIRPRLFGAGPAAMEALFAGEIDLLYIGPSPAVLGYIRSRGEAVRVIAGAASGGAVFVVRPGVDPLLLEGRHLASPQLGNTQDIALRHHLERLGLRTVEQGGTVRVSPAGSAEIMGLFVRGDLDGAWVAEPWGSRLLLEAGAELAFDERDLWPDRTFAATLLVVSPRYLKAHPERVRGLLEGHVAITRWLQSEPAQAVPALQEALADLQGRPLPAEVIALALSRIEFRYDPMVSSVEEQAMRAFRLGFLGRKAPDLSGLFDLSLLQEVAP